MDGKSAEGKVWILYVNLDHEDSTVAEVDYSILRKYIGGVGLGAKILWDETSAETAPFSPENRLMFLIGPITGKVPLSSRAVVCALSPLNDAWGEAAMGGSWGSELSNTGVCGIVFSGRARKPVYLYIKDNDVKIKDASHLWGKDTFETSELLQQETDRRACVATIGRAGERLSRIAGIVCEGRFARVAARCGLGGVMGSKNLKAVVVHGTQKPKVADETRLKSTTRDVQHLLSQIKSGALGPRVEPKDAIATMNEVGSLAVKNHTLARWNEFNSKFQKSQNGTHYYCRLCPVSCTESHTIGFTRQHVLESVMPIGSNCLIDNFDALQQGYELCNRYGIDTISFGYTLAFAMEAFEKGLINREHTGGIDLTWGNHEAMLEMIRQVGENEGFGKVLGQGSLRAAEQIGGDALQYTLQSKGLEVTQWDPRIYNSLMLGYATGNKGGSHYESPGHAIERRRLAAGYGIDLAEFGCPQGANRLGFEGKAMIVKKMQDVVCLINSLVICQFSFNLYGLRIGTYLSWLNSIAGYDMETKEFLQAGERIFNLKRLVNLRRGLSGKDDTIPPRFLTKLPDLNDEEQNIPLSFNKLLHEYYAWRGWTNEGIPTQKKCSELGLPHDGVRVV